MTKKTILFSVIFIVILCFTAFISYRIGKQSRITDYSRTDDYIVVNIEVSVNEITPTLIKAKFMPYEQMLQKEIDINITDSLTIHNMEGGIIDINSINIGDILIIDIQNTKKLDNNIIAVANGDIFNIRLSEQ